MSRLKLSELCTAIGERGVVVALDGDDREVHGVNTLELARAGEVSFLSNPRYGEALRSTGASAVFCRPEVGVPDGIAALRCDDPYAAVTFAVVALHGYRAHPRWGRAEGSRIDPTAELGPGVHVAPGATIAAGARVGAASTLYPGAYVGERAVLGERCVLYPNAVVYEGCRLGDRCTVHAGSVIGQDGLGYARHDGRWVKIPQVGVVELGDDVEIGANCSIDRATLGATRVGSGTKFGNGNVVGHGTRIGERCLLVGQIGLAGSVAVGDDVTLAGQVGSVGHVKIGDGATVGAQSGITSDVPAGATYFGSPAQPLPDELRAHALVRKLGELQRRVAELERRLAARERERGHDRATGAASARGEGGAG